jgi:hypothetical protein
MKNEYFSINYHVSSMALGSNNRPSGHIRRPSGHIGILTVLFPVASFGSHCTKSELINIKLPKLGTFPNYRVLL